MGELVLSCISKQDVLCVADRRPHSWLARGSECSRTVQALLPRCILSESHRTTRLVSALTTMTPYCTVRAAVPQN